MPQLLLPEPDVIQFDAEPHNGTPETQRVCPDGVRRGGQILLIWLCLNFPRVIAPIGRRGGKSSGTLFLVLEEAGMIDGMYYVGYITIDHAKAKETMERFIEAFGGDPKDNPDSLITKIHRSAQQDRYIELGPMDHDDYPDVHNEGTRMYFFSGKYPHYSAIQGFMHPFHRFIGDESSYVRGGCHSKVVLPMLIDSGGKLLLTGAVDNEGIGYAAYESYAMRGESEAEEWLEWELLNLPTESNPTLHPGAAATMRAECSDPETELMQLDGKFPKNTSTVFGQLDKVFVLPPRGGGIPHWLHRCTEEANLDYPIQQATFEDYTKNVPYLVTVDWARKQDFTAIGIYRLDTGRQCAIIRLFGEDYDRQLDFVRAIRKEWGQAASIRCDSTGVGEGMLDLLQKKWNEPATGVNFSAKERLVRLAQTLFRAKQIKMINAPWQREEFRLYIGERSERTGRIKFGHPDDVHDDCVDQLLVAVDMLINPWEEQEEDGAEQPQPEVKRGTMGEFRQAMIAQGQLPDHDEVEYMDEVPW